jgi:hypothetical protein
MGMVLSLSQRRMVVTIVIKKEREKIHQSKSQSVKIFINAEFGMFIHF